MTQHASQHPVYQAHHFKSMDQQTSAGKLGMWIFMAQEMLFFSGLFCAYGYVRILYPETFYQCLKFMDWRVGGVNSIILLVSSLTMSLSVRAVRLNQIQESTRYLIFTMICGFTFIIIKGSEWAKHFKEGLFPGRFFNPDHDIIINSQVGHLFFSIYYVITGMHGLHIIIGLGIMVWMLVRLCKKEFNSENYVALENTSLFWHLVDVVWLFVYPLLYLASS